MDFCIRLGHNYHKSIKSKLLFPLVCDIQPQRDFSFDRSSNEPCFPVTKSSQIKAYHDLHLFKDKLQTMNCFPQQFKRSLISRQKTESVQFETVQRKKESKRLNNLSYKQQKTQRSLKEQKAIEDLKQIGEINFNHINCGKNYNIRISRLQNYKSPIKTQRKQRTVSKQKNQASNTPFKNRQLLRKRVKNSPKRTALSLSVRKTFVRNSKASKNSNNISTVESEKKQRISLRICKRKSSITPWQIGEFQLN